MKETKMLTIGDKVPDFELPNQDDELVRLSDYQGKKVVLFAFPMAGTAECTKQACIYRDSYEDFQKFNATVIGITGNPTSALRLWRNKHGFPYELLSDKEHKVLDVLGAWGQPVVGKIVLPLAQRSYWVINEDGIIEDMKIGINAQETVNFSLAFVQEAASS